ncbi:thiol-disulfide oxidoreductase-associated membrane protein CcdA2 [Aerococcaceae bacterium NML130460]|nr:thiol-disulfide oxidoreductase-associated membrane protein CcdA2 [Aerococcaceae bacterium NML180378]MCW6681142.1 thiol-disulfide oxidoreductase-associated membrane protein CcdA2 [Aerococcaceae bacterium NML130460]
MEYQAVFYGTVFIAGVLSFFSPCILPLLPIYFGKLAGDVGDKQLILFGKVIHLLPIFKTLAFIFGIGTVFIILGYGAGALGHFINHPYFTYVLGAFVIMLGIHQMELINISLLQRQKNIAFKQKTQNDILEVYLLGLSFSFGWTPCVGPVLGSVLAIAASDGGGALYGASLMFCYTLGLALPFLVLAVGSTYMMQHVNFMKRHILEVKRIGGALIVLMGILLMFGQVNYLTSLF